VGGPSAGFALAINTLSALLNLRMSNDFGITGAPWTKGVKRGEVGGSVIIGGHKKKTEVILTHLQRMYMPQKNYQDLDQEYLVNYWLQGKDIIGVVNFGDLVPEVLWLDQDYGDRVYSLVMARIRRKLKQFQGENAGDDSQATIEAAKRRLKAQMETEIRRRLAAICTYIQNPTSDPYLSLEAIFQPDAVRPGRKYLEGSG
jgi:predicted S18 family serine protease